MGTSTDSDLSLTAGPIPAWLKCHSVFEDAESRVQGLFASIQRFATGPNRQTAGMVTVKERHQHAVQPLHDVCYCQKPLFGVTTTSIIPISVIQGSVHLLVLTPQPESLLWYCSNAIDLDAFNTFYM